MMQTLREFLREYSAKLPDVVLNGKIRRVALREKDNG